MDGRDRHNGQIDKRKNERTDGRTVEETRRVASLRPSVRLLDGVSHARWAKPTAPRLLYRIGNCSLQANGDVSQ